MNSDRSVDDSFGMAQWYALRGRASGRAGGRSVLVLGFYG